MQISDQAPPKVLHILASSASGGAPLNTQWLIERQKAIGFVAIQKDDEVNWAGLAGMAQAIRDVKVRSLGLRPLRAIIAFAREQGVVLIHTHGLGAGLYGRLAGLVLGLPVVHTYHGFHNRFRGIKSPLYILYERVFAFFTARTIAVSSSERAKVIAAGAAPADKVAVVLNPVQLSKVEPAEAPTLEPGKFHVAALSRLSPQKDLITLIEVARQLGEDFVVHVFGGVNESDVGYAETVRREALGVGNIRFHGDVPFAAALLPRFDAYVTTALWEGLPTAVVEAFLAGTPVVATDCTGNCDLVRDGENGLMCAPKDAAAVARALRRLQVDPSLGKALAHAAQVEARATFDPDRLVAQVDDIYQRAMRRRP